jgi:hypothetical protein
MIWSRVKGDRKREGGGGVRGWLWTTVYWCEQLNPNVTAPTPNFERRKRGTETGRRGRRWRRREEGGVAVRFGAHAHLDFVNLVGDLCPEIIDNLIELGQCKRLQLLLRVIKEGQDTPCSDARQRHTPVRHSERQKENATVRERKTYPSGARGDDHPTTVRTLNVYVPTAPAARMQG